MRTLLLTSFIVLSLTSTAALAQRDSTGQGNNLPQRFGDTIYSTTWDRIQGKPPTFAPDPHHHDSRYIRRGEHLAGVVVGGGSKRSNAKATAWGAASAEGSRWVGTVECPPGTRKVRTGHTPSTTRTWTTPGCDGGCGHSETSPAETFWLCIATGPSGAPVGHAEITSDD